MSGTGISGAAPLAVGTGVNAEPPTLEDIIVDCPYCGHAWKEEARWMSSACPNCGKMVYRYMDPKHD